MIKQDFNFLDKVEIPDLSERESEIFGIPYHVDQTKSKNEFRNWIYSRIHFFIKDTSSEKLINKIKVYKTDVDFPQALDFPRYDYFSFGTESLQLENDLSGKSTFQESSEKFMSNIGTPIYFTGKLQHVSYKLKMRSGTLSHSEIIVNSPRVGVIQLGSALDDVKYLINSSNVEAFSNRILRLSILFHEARHSDGNGNSLGFLHTRCPKGHSYSGAFACDFNTNGPYTVGAEVAKILLRTCKTCTLFEKEKMNLLILDSLSRRVGKEKYAYEPICKTAISTESETCDWNFYSERIGPNK